MENGLERWQEERQGSQLRGPCPDPWAPWAPCVCLFNLCDTVSFQGLLAALRPVGLSCSSCPPHPLCVPSTPKTFSRHIHPAGAAGRTVGTQRRGHGMEGGPHGRGRRAQHHPAKLAAPVGRSRAWRVGLAPSRGSQRPWVIKAISHSLTMGT